MASQRRTRSAATSCVPCVSYSANQWRLRVRDRAWQAGPLDYAPDGAGLVRLAEYASKTAARKECAEFISPASVDAEQTQHIG